MHVIEEMLLHTDVLLTLTLSNFVADALLYHTPMRGHRSWEYVINAMCTASTVVLRDAMYSAAFLSATDGTMIHLQTTVAKLLSITHDTKRL